MAIVRLGIQIRFEILVVMYFKHLRFKFALERS